MLAVEAIAVWHDDIDIGIKKTERRNWIQIVVDALRSFWTWTQR